MGLGKFKAKSDGVRVKLDREDGADGAVLFIRRASILCYRTEVAKILDDNRLGGMNRAQRRNGNVDLDAIKAHQDSVGYSIDCEAPLRDTAGRLLLVGWENLIDELGDFGPQGEKIPFSQEMARRIMTHHDYAEFQAFVLAFAHEEANFRAELDTADAKN